MKKQVPVMLVVAGLALSCSAAPPVMQEGVMLKADGEIIDVEIGHLVPCVTDWNNDGKKDLISGQFREGKIRLYLNRGTDSKPVLKDLTFLTAGGAEISLPAG